LKEVSVEHLATPFPRLTYREAMEKYGTDKPDLRNPLTVGDYNKPGKSGDFGILNKAEKIRGIKVKGLFSRSEMSEFEEIVKEAGAKGLLYLCNEAGSYKGPFVKYFKNLDVFGLAEGETLFLSSSRRTANRTRKETIPYKRRMEIFMGDRFSVV
jgi:aspartyl-tRNA synthetase